MQMLLNSWLAAISNQYSWTRVEFAPHPAVRGCVKTHIHHLSLKFFLKKVSVLSTYPYPSCFGSTDWKGDFKCCVTSLVAINLKETFRPIAEFSIRRWRTEKANSDMSHFQTNVVEVSTSIWSLFSIFLIYIHDSLQK